MNKSLSFTAAVIVSAFFAVLGEVHAQEALCGAPPSLPTSAQTEESIKGQLKGQADFLSKLVGKAELEGQVDAARKQIYQSSDRFLAAQKDAYLSYVFCVIIMQDKSLSTSQKLDAINTFKKSMVQRLSDPRILFECHFSPLPDVMPDAPFYQMQLLGQKYDGGFGTFGQNPGEKLPWGNIEPKAGIMCKLTNYGASPVLNVQMDLPVEYRKAVKQGNGPGSGDIVLQQTLPTPSVNIDVGNRNMALLLYINRSPYFVSATMPTTARLQQLGSDEWQTVNLIPPHPGQSMFFLWPFNPSTNPPTGVPPARKTGKHANRKVAANSGGRC
jgi:hypothetical protein